MLLGSLCPPLRARTSPASATWQDQTRTWKTGESAQGGVTVRGANIFERRKNEKQQVDLEGEQRKDE